MKSCHIKKVNSKCIIDLNMKPKVIKLLEDKKSDKSLCDLLLGIDFLDKTKSIVHGRKKNWYIGVLSKYKTLAHQKIFLRE